MELELGGGEGAKEMGGWEEEKFIFWLPLHLSPGSIFVVSSP